MTKCHETLPCRCITNVGMSHIRKPSAYRGLQSSTAPAYHLPYAECSPLQDLACRIREAAPLHTLPGHLGMPSVGAAAAAPLVEA